MSHYSHFPPPSSHSYWAFCEVSLISAGTVCHILLTTELMKAQREAAVEKSSAYDCITFKTFELKTVFCTFF